jgi:hypothetical protein
VAGLLALRHDAIRLAGQSAGEFGLKVMAMLERDDRSPCHKEEPDCSERIKS